MKNLNTLKQKRKARINGEDEVFGTSEREIALKTNIHTKIQNFAEKNKDFFENILKVPLDEKNGEVNFKALNKHFNSGYEQITIASGDISNIERMMDTKAARIIARTIGVKTGTMGDVSSADYRY